MENAIIEKELEGQALTLKGQATSMIVQDVAGYAAAGELGKGIKELRQKIVDYFKPLKDAAHKAHKAITEKEGLELKPVDEAINILRDTMNAFTRKQEEIRVAAGKKARDEAEAIAAAGREKLLKAAVKAEKAANKAEKASVKESKESKSAAKASKPNATAK